MGITNMTCAVSGLPIVPGNAIVAIPLEHCPAGVAEYFSGAPYIPRDFPIFGEYTGYPGEDGTCGMAHAPCALVLTEVWEKGEEYWEHAKDLYFPVGTIFDAHEEGAKTIERMLGLRDHDAMFFFLTSVMTGKSAECSEGREAAWWALRALFTAGKNVCNAKDALGAALVCHNAFAKEVCLGIAGTWQDTDTASLKRLLGLWMGQRLLGKYITPAAPRAGQDPEYDARLEIMRMHLAIGVGLKKDYDDAVLAADDDEEVALSISAHTHAIPDAAQLVSAGPARLRLFRCRYCGGTVNTKADGTPLPCPSLSCPCDIRADPYAHVLRIPEQDDEIPLWSEKT